MTAATETGPATVRATRYVSPFREGGSLPGLVEADDDGLYVLKFRGAGQGPRALVAELLGGELARAAEVLWLDSLLQNVDRTANNPNLLVWHGQVWLIDHGAAIYAHHGDPLLRD